MGEALDFKCPRCNNTNFRVISSDNFAECTNCGEHKPLPLEESSHV